MDLSRPASAVISTALPWTPHEKGEKQERKEEEEETEEAEAYRVPHLCMNMQYERLKWLKNG